MTNATRTGHLQVVGGGVGGLVTAITAQEAGWQVALYEAHDHLGGRARTAAGAHRANWGPHVVYRDGSLWSWLDQRGLARPAGRPPLRRPIRLRCDGKARRLPPRDLVTAVWRVGHTEAPVDRSFTEWATPLVGERATRRLASLMGVATFDADPGRLSARFLQERIRRSLRLPPSATYIPGGWSTLVDRLSARARQLGVDIVTGVRVDGLPEPPVVLAVPLARAAELLGDPTLHWTGARTALLDVGLRAARGGSFAVADLDQSGWAEAFDMADRTLAPAGEHLVQAQMGLRPDESLDAGVARIEELLDAGYAGWRDRETWRRRAVIDGESGALDLPGTTWEDRPAIDRGGGVYLVGDMVAAPGLLSEVSVNSALAAVAALAGAVTGAGTGQPTATATTPGPSGSGGR